MSNISRNTGNVGSPTAMISPAESSKPSRHQTALTSRDQSLASLALVVGTAAFLLGWMPVIGFLAGVAGIGIAATALLVARPKSWPLAGMALSGIATATSIAATLWLLQPFPF